jgi:hypothetical protein
MNYRENILKAYRFETPKWIPISVGFVPLLWSQYDCEAIEDLMLTHKILFPGYQKGDISPERIEILPEMTAGRPYVDHWGCVWETKFTGMVGTVIKHPLADWDAFENFVPPDPSHTDGMKLIDWDQIEAQGKALKKDGQLFALYLPHGHTFLRLQDLRGYENLMFDMMDSNKNLEELINLVEHFNLELVMHFNELQPDMIGIPEDLGTQSSAMISPELFKKYIQPSYVKMTVLIRQSGTITHLHSDGYIMELVDDIIDSGVDVINLQDLVNGIDNIQKHVKGRAAIDLDIDRQDVTVNGSAKDIDEHLFEIVSKLSSKNGGLSLSYQPWPPTPIENIRAVMEAMEKHCGYL